MDFSAPNFLKAAVAAFPPDRRLSADGAANLLLPFVDPNYRQSTVRVIVRGKTVHIPKRIHFIGLCDAKLEEERAPLQVVQCLRTRSTDGFERQAALRHILPLNEPWAIPFVVLLAGEYVVEIYRRRARRSAGAKPTGLHRIRSGKSRHDAPFAIEGDQLLGLLPRLLSQSKFVSRPSFFINSKCGQINLGHPTIEGQIKGHTLRLAGRLILLRFFAHPAMCGLGAQCVRYCQPIAQ